MSTDKEPEKPEGHPDPKPVGGPMSIIFPPDRLVWAEARKMAVERNARVDDLAACAAQDPIIVIELLKTANAMYYSGGRQPITTTKTAIVRLGSDVVLETLDKMQERGDIGDENVAHWLEVHRSRGRRTSIVARMIAEVVAKTLADECQVAGLLSTVGDLLAVAHLGEHYVKLAEEHSRSGVLYRLVQDYRFNVETLGTSYLTRQGIPQLILAAIDRDSAIKAQDKVVMKPVVSSAQEMVEAFDMNRWEKLAPGRSFPPKSALRLLQVSEVQYVKLYERASQYLFQSRADEEKKKHATLGMAFESSEVEVPTSPPPTLEEKSAEPASDTNLENELQSLMNNRNEEEIEDLFSLNSAPKKNKKKFRPPPRAVQPSQPTGEIKLKKAAEMVTSMTEVLETAQTSEELLSSLLKELVDRGPFEKTALIVVSKDRKNAIVVAARGPNVQTGQRIAIDNPLSPLSQNFSKVQSFGRASSEHSPFGSSTFALAPIDADHDTPVALYADCGNGGSINFEARRIFRTVVDLLNQKLPSLPGGIPVELQS
jgi:HD-like signal output (HDOD) protein